MVEMMANHLVALLAIRLVDLKAKKKKRKGGN
jgi:hypothetical protein